MIGFDSECADFGTAFDVSKVIAENLPWGRVGKGIRGVRNFADDAAKVPGNPFRGKNAPRRAYEHLRDNHGLDPHVASNRLHKLKKGRLAPDDDVIIGRTGDVYDARTGERLGTLTDKSLGS